MSILQFTNSYGANDLKHLLDDIAGLPADAPIHTALAEEGITTVVNLLNLSDEDLNTLSYFNGQDMRLHIRELGVCFAFSLLTSVSFRRTLSLT
jgi:hypothetical protein